MDQLVERALSEIEARGPLTPERVVEVARDPQHPLHAFFEWDDAVAAHKHRLDQARALIRIAVTITTVVGAQYEIPKYVRNPDLPIKEQGYVQTRELAPDSAVRVVEKEIERAIASLERAIGIASSTGQQKLADRCRKATAVLQQATVATSNRKRNRGEDEQPALVA